jgi:hypothetical protein
MRQNNNFDFDIKKISYQTNKEILNNYKDSKYEKVDRYEGKYEEEPI